MDKTTSQFPVFTIEIDFRNMSASGEVRFENSLNSLHGTFTAKTHAIQICPEMGYSIKNVQKNIKCLLLKLTTEICLQLARLDFQTI